MSKLDEIERLARLRDQGVLTDAEFASEKGKLLGGDNATAPPMLHNMTPDSVSDGGPQNQGPSPAVEEDDAPSLWAFWLPINTPAHANAVLKASYLAATSIAFLGVRFSADLRVSSPNDPVALIGGFVLLIGGAFWMARHVARARGQWSALGLIAILCGQGFGLTQPSAADFGIGDWAVAIVGLIYAVQSFRGTIWEPEKQEG